MVAVAKGYWKHFNCLSICLVFIFYTFYIYNGILKYIIILFYIFYLIQQYYDEIIV